MWLCFYSELLQLRKNRKKDHRIRLCGKLVTTIDPNELAMRVRKLTTNFYSRTYPVPSKRKRQQWPYPRRQGASRIHNSQVFISEDSVKLPLRENGFHLHLFLIRSAACPGLRWMGPRPPGAFVAGDVRSGRENTKQLDRNLKPLKVNFGPNHVFSRKEISILYAV